MLLSVYTINQGVKNRIMTEKKHIIWRVLPWAAVVLWMAVIFLFSTQTGEQSGDLSGGLTERLAAVLTPGWETLSAAEQAKRLDIWHLLIRKAAHVTEFAILGGLLMNAWTRQHRCAGWRQAALAAGCGLLWAASDELHQAFVPGRGPAVTDVLIDFGGVLLGVGLIWAILYKCTKSGSHSKKVHKHHL